MSDDLGGTDLSYLAQRWSGTELTQEQIIRNRVEANAALTAQEGRYLLAVIDKTRDGHTEAAATRTDIVDHPRHYNVNPSGVECITVVEHMSFNLGNAVKYIWRADEKGKALEDLRKAAWYVQREIERTNRAEAD